MSRTGNVSWTTVTVFINPLWHVPLCRQCGQPAGKYWEVPSIVYNILKCKLVETRDIKSPPASQVCGTLQHQRKYCGKYLEEYCGLSIFPFKLFHAKVTKFQGLKTRSQSPNDPPRAGVCQCWEAGRRVLGTYCPVSLARYRASDAVRPVTKTKVPSARQQTWLMCIHTRGQSLRSPTLASSS